MPKTITSPVKHFGGTVVISDPLTMPQVVRIDECLISRRRYFDEVETDGERGYTLKPDVFWSSPDTTALDAILLCVEEFHLERMPEKVSAETFPGSPRVASKRLIDWLLGEILIVYNGEADIPNE